MKKCPHCGKEIKDDAQKDKKIFKGCLLGCLVILVLSILAIAIMAYLGYFTVKYISERTYPGPGGYFYYYRGGIEGIFGGIIDAFRAFIEKIKDFFHIGIKVV